MAFKNLFVLVVMLQSLFLAKAFAGDRKPEYLFEVKGTNQIIYVDAPTQFSYEFNVYVGEPGKLKSVKVNRVSRMRDGGTTHINLADGSSIYSPSPFKKNEKASYTDSSGKAVELNSLATTESVLASKNINVEEPTKLLASTEAPKHEKPTFIEPDSNPLAANDVIVDHGFTDWEGNLIVRFRYGARSIGTNMTFWSPKGDTKLYQLDEHGFGGTSSVYKLTFGAPSEANLKRAGELNVNTNDKELKLSCDGGSACFRQLSDSEQQKLQAQILGGQRTLEGLPNLRRVEYVFKVEGTDTYIIVDSPKYNYGYDFEVHIGTKGNMVPVEVLDVQRYRDGGTTNIMLANGQTIHSPTPFKKEAKPVLITAANEHIDLEKQGHEVSILKDLGMDTRKFNATSLKTPVNCLEALGGL